MEFYPPYQGFPWEFFRGGNFSRKLHENERISIFTKGLSKMKEFEGFRGQGSPFGHDRWGGTKQ